MPADAPHADAFPATRHSLVSGLGAADEPERRRAFETLARLYWRPIMVYLQRQWHMEQADAEDLTQSFFAAALEGKYFERFDAKKARFRTFVRVCLDRHVSKALDHQNRLKRGGHLGLVSLDGLDLPDPSRPEDVADRIFRDEWMRHLFAMAVARLEALLVERGNAVCYQVFAAYDLAEPTDPSDTTRPTYASVAARFGIPATQVTNYLNLARRHLREIVVDELRVVTGTDRELRAEARALLGLDG